MSKYFSFLSPLATLTITWYWCMFLMFLPPLWILWPLVTGGLLYVNFRGIHYVLGHGAKNKRWHHISNTVECLIAAVLLVLFFAMDHADVYAICDAPIDNPTQSCPADVD